MHFEKSGSCLPSVAAIVILDIVLLLVGGSCLALMGSGVPGFLHMLWPSALAVASALVAAGFREKSRFLPEFYFLSLFMTVIGLFRSLVLAVMIGFPGPG